MSIKFKLLGEEKLFKSLEQKRTSIAEEIIKTVNLVTLKVHRDIIKSIQQGPKSGRKYEGRLEASGWVHKPSVKGPNNTGRPHQASAKGEAPATDTGNLVRNIVPKVMKSGFDIFGIITSKAEYSNTLEFGSKDLGERPFMRPALKRNRKMINEKLMAAIQKGLNE